MNWKIIWTQAAREDYSELLIYVEKTYGSKAAEKLFDKVEKTLQNISAFPRLFPKSKKINGFKAVVTKQTSIIYLIGDSEVFIVRFKDNRMEE